MGGWEERHMAEVSRLFAGDRTVTSRVKNTYTRSGAGFSVQTRHHLGGISRHKMQTIPQNFSAVFPRGILAT